MSEKSTIIVIPFLYIDLGSNEPGMTLQRQDGNDWVNYKVDGKAVKSPVDIDKLPAGRYRLVDGLDNIDASFKPEDNRAL
jgi:hypothetical protein